MRIYLTSTARYLYDSEYDDLIESELPHFEISEISLSQSIQV